MNNSASKKSLRQTQIILMFLLITFSQYGWTQGNGYWEDRFAAPYLGGVKEDEFVEAIAVTESKEIYVTGVLSINGRYHTMLKWNGVAWEPFGGINNYVDALLLADDYLYVGGRFIRVGDTVSANRVARYNLKTKSWSALGEGASNGVNVSGVNAMAFSGEDLYVGGPFTIAGGAQAIGIAKWSTTTNLWTPLGGGIEGSVNSVVDAIVVKGNEVYVGGTFKSAGGVPVNHIAKWDGEKWSSLEEGVNDLVFALTLVGDDLYVGGKFTKASGITVDGIARWDTKSQKWFALDYIAGCGGSYVFALASYNDMLLVGGALCTRGTPPIQRGSSIGRWSLLHKKWSSLGISPNYDIYSIQVRGPEIYVGGRFSRAGDMPSNLFAVWHEPLKHAPQWFFPPNLLFHKLTFGEDGRNRWELLKHVSDADDSLAALSFKAEVLGKQVTGNKWQKTSALQININPATKIANFKASPDSFGVFKVAFMVTDLGGQSDTTTMHVRVNPRNDPPVFANLPEAITFRNDASKRLAMWDFVSDAEDADSSLHFSFSASNDSLKRAFNAQTGMLTLTAPGFIGKADLFLTVRDDSNAVARDTISVQVDYNTTVAEPNSEIPTEFVLLQNYPNPFNPTTTIRFGLPHASEVKLEVFDLSGQRVAMLLNERKNAGFHAIEFEASSLSSGTYFYKLTAGSFGERKKLLLVK